MWNVCGIPYLQVHKNKAGMQNRDAMNDVDEFVNRRPIRSTKIVPNK